LEEVEPGIVAYFDHAVLLREVDIDRDDDGIDRPGPFVCIQVVGDKSVWGAVTSEWSRPRLLLKPEWRQDGNPRWTGRPQYLNDGLSTYVGPTAAFLRAASAEQPFTPFLRPRVTAPGISAIIAEVNRQGGPLLEGSIDV
jgi:hypothetical protein